MLTTFAAFVEAKVLLPTARRVAAVVAEASKGAAREANLLELQLRSDRRKYSRTQAYMAAASAVVENLKAD